MGIFGRRIDIKNASKTTYSDEDLRKLDLNYRNEFQIDREKRIYTPFRKEMPRAWQSQVRDMAFEKILDDRIFSFRHMLVIPNPYGASVQTAMLLFNTPKEYRVRYRIFGKLEGTDFVGETRMTTRHRVPVIGLYKGYTNKLILELIDAEGEVYQRRDLKIYTRDIPLGQQNIVTKVEHSQTSCFPFVLVNGFRFKPVVFDQNGEVRYSLQIRTDRTGMIPLENGRFLYVDATVNRVASNGGKVACQYHEMDYMGRVYQTYLLDYPVGRYAAQNGDSLFLLTSSAEGYTDDCIVELDRCTGQIRRKCLLEDLIGDKYKKKGDWIVASGMQYVQGQLILTMRRYHTVVSIDWEKQSVNWVLAPDPIWRDTALAGKLLRSVDQNIVDGYMPESPEIQMQEDGHILIRLYCIQNKGSVPVEGAVSDDDSRIDFYELYPKEQTFHKLRSVAVVKSQRDAGCVYREQEDRILSLSGMLLRRTENLRACIEELDGQTGQMINRLRLCKRYRSAWVFAPDIEAYSVPLQHDLDAVKGSLEPPEKFTGSLPEPVPEKLKKKVFGNIRVSDTLFLFAFFAGSVQNVYLIGETYSYVQRFSKLAPQKRRSSFCMTLDQLELDEYQVYVEVDDQIYHLKNEIRVERSQKEK